MTLQIFILSQNISVTANILFYHKCILLLQTILPLKINYITIMHNNTSHYLVTA